MKRFILLTFSILIVFFLFFNGWAGKIFYAPLVFLFFEKTKSNDGAVVAQNSSDNLVVFNGGTQKALPYEKSEDSPERGWAFPEDGRNVALSKTFNEFFSVQDAFGWGWAYFPWVLRVMNPMTYFPWEVASLRGIETDSQPSSISSVFPEFLDPAAGVSGSSFITKEMIDGPSQSAVDSGRSCMHLLCTQIL